MVVPEFSVLIPAFNHEGYVADAIDSALDQDLDGIELVVIDDASGDSTWEVVQRYRSDPRVRLFRHETNAGAHATLNEALALARGRYLAILNSDDAFAPGRLAKCRAELDAGAALVGSDIQLIDTAGRIVPEHWWVDAFEALKKRYRDSGDVVTALLAGNLFMTTSNFAFTRELMEGVGGFRVQRYVHDYDFLLRAVASGRLLRWLDEPLLRYRIHPSNTISSNPLDANRECAALLRETLPKLFGQADDRAGQRLEALSGQFERLERYIVEIMLTQRHEALVEQEMNWRGEVELRDRWIADRDRWIAERDDWIAERDHKIAEQAGLLQRMQQHPLRRAMGRVRAIAKGGTRLQSVFRRVLALDVPLRMEPVRVRSFDELKAWLEPRLSGIGCVSFDIFDTLVQRCIEPPEWLHRRASEKISVHLGGVPDAATILAARHEEERALREASGADGGDHECHFDPLVEGWVLRLLGRRDAKLEERIHSIERQLERSALSAKPGAQDLLRWLKTRGVRVIAVSDMYLGHRHVNELLDDIGFGTLIDAMYVSADFGFGKYTGRLHQKVLEVEGMNPETVVHVGDNLMSDMLGAARVGVQGVFLDEEAPRLRRRHQQLSAGMAEKGGVWPGRMLCEVVDERLRGLPEAQRDDFHFRFGLQVLGPLFSTFMLGLVERLHVSRPDRIYFLARDGFLFKSLYERYRAQLSDPASLPDATYLYASRRVLAIASVADGLTLEQARVAFYNPKQQGLLSVCKTYGIDPAALGPYAEEHGFARLDEPVLDWDDVRLKALIDDDRVQMLASMAGREMRVLLHEYLKANGFFDSGSVAFVDIGWNGTIQKFLVESFGSETGFPIVHGYYYALGNGMYGAFDPGGSIEGLMMDARDGNPCERAPSDFEELFEQGARSPEATTIGYRRERGGVVPVLKSDEAPDRIDEIACNPDILAMQQGVELHFDHFVAVQELTGFRFAQLRPYVLGLTERVVVYPDEEEVRHIGSLAHTEDFGHDNVLNLNAQRLVWRDFLRPRRLHHRLRQLPWRYAPLAGFAAPWAAWLLRLAHLRNSYVRKR